LFKKKFPFYTQLDAMDCGPTCLKMIAEFYGTMPDFETIRRKSGFGRNGVSLLGISNAAEAIGFRTASVMLSFTQLINEVPLPCVVHWNQQHFVVITPHSYDNRIEVADPAGSLIHYNKKDFLLHWSTKNDEGVALLLEPTPLLYEQKDYDEKGYKWQLIIKYLTRYKKYFLQMLIGLLLSAFIQFILPFLAQNIIDKGINTQNLIFINIVLIAQFVLFFSRTIIDFIRSRLLLFTSTHLNLSILSDFWVKLMALPLSFHDTKQTGDILQRINDHKRIESFLTGTALNTVFSCFSLIAFSIVLLMYGIPVFSIFFIGSVLYVVWVSVFLKKRRKLDYKKFEASARENTATMQLINGIQDIKLNNSEQLRRQDWEHLQGRVFKLGFATLSLNQYQQAGALFLNEGKNILITFFVTRAVLNGELTLGAMVAIQYIIGQLNSPVEQLVTFFQQAQDAKISLERLNDIHHLEEEESPDKSYVNHLPEIKTLQLENLSFTYQGAGEQKALSDISLSIPENKITAIVGMSGSGKTTLLKLLLNFYGEYEGDVKVGETNLKYISPSLWRSNCAAVMQDGFIYNDSIAKNIAVKDTHPDYERLRHAAKVANILPFIEKLPNGFETKIGNEGIGISQGQKQRLLIARAVYKEPHYIFFDEATNALDANNERIIMENLQHFFKDRTVIIVAHRLSTVKNADNIIVLDNGRIIEHGHHTDLITLQGEYYNLVKNQLELGN
jgi:ATP-binding cassette subfamily B protein